MKQESIESLLKDPSELKWYYFSQNNSGGYFVEDDNVCENVFIQRYCAQDALDFAHQIMDNDDSCPCCGDRWSFWLREENGTNEPMFYGESLYTAEATLFRNKAILHHYDGTITTVELKKK